MRAVVQGTIGVDAGCGSGRDSVAMAVRHPHVEVCAVDISEGVDTAFGRTSHLPNVHVVRGSVLKLPFRSDLFDFAYSFGVLHHTPAPEQGLCEIVRVLKPGGRLSLYLYEDHSANLWKAIPLKIIGAVRLLTTRLPPRILSGLCYFFSPIVVAFFSVPARIMERFGPTHPIAARLPFNFGTSLLSVHGDLLDRFGAPIEIRYSRQGVEALLQTARLSDMVVTKLKTLAGWVVQACKK